MLVFILITVIVPAIILPSTEFAAFALIGVIGGLSLFVSGLRLLARKRLLLSAPGSNISSGTPLVGKLVENPGIEDNRAISMTNERPPRHAPSTPPPEIVRLSDVAAPPTAGEMTQQSKIAAALAKAGMNSPVATATDVPYREAAVKASTHVEQLSVNRKGQTPEPEEHSAFDPAQPVVSIKSENYPEFLISWRTQQPDVRSLAWKSSAMIWGGGAITLLGLYVLLAQLELL